MPNFLNIFWADSFFFSFFQAKKANHLPFLLNLLHLERKRRGQALVVPMSDSFFQKKRKRTNGTGVAGKERPVSVRTSGRNADGKKAGPSRLRMREKAGAQKDDGEGGGDDNDEEEGVDIDDMDLRHRYDSDLQESDEDEMETPAEAKVRLAKLYLEGLRGDEVGECKSKRILWELLDAYHISHLKDPNDADAAEADRQNIAARLQQDVSSQTSHIHNFIADQINLPHQDDTSHILACRGHKASVTCAFLDPSFQSLWTAGKDGQMIRWRLKDGKMMEQISKSEVEGVRAQKKQPTSSTSGAARRRARAAFMASAPHEMRGKHESLTNGHLSNGKTREQYCKSIIPGHGQGHSDEIWALTISSDGKYLVSGGKDRRICVWSLESGETSFVRAMGGHKDSITALRFRLGSHDLFTASSDRTLKLFDVSQLSYVETFFGHQEEVASLDILRGEVAVSAGSRDRTVRWWKVREESQLVFRGGAKSKVRDVLEGGDLFEEDDDGPRKKKSAVQETWVEGSIDCVAMIDEHNFLSGGDSGTISLWSLSKKKPIFTAPIAHGFHVADTETEGRIQTPRWITSLACLPYGDVFASGSWDGRIRLWKLNANLRSFSALYEIPLEGFINSLQLTMPSRSILKRQPNIIEEASWRRKGGLKGGAKKVFDESIPEKENVTPETNGGLTNGVSTSSKSFLILSIGVGQEPTRGRWLRIKEAKNGASIIPLHLY